MIEIRMETWRGRTAGTNVLNCGLLVIDAGLASAATRSVQRATQSWQGLCRCDPNERQPVIDLDADRSVFDSVINRRGYGDPGINDTRRNCRSLTPDVPWLLLQFLHS